jgi:hypothetical protein
MLLGLDFDNTLIRYDELFHTVARERNWIPESVPRDKNAVRDYLRADGREDDWTLLQGIVYGSRILDAQPYDGALATLDRLTRGGVAMRVVSHKTKAPYRGEPCDLHGAARQWLERQGFHDHRRLGWPRDAVFFELTKEDKVARIVELGCTHYVDDLPEILEMLPDHVVKVHFAPNGVTPGRPEWLTLRDWFALPALVGLS